MQPLTNFFILFQYLTFKIELFAPPKGEGSSYDASYKDLRPSLDWDPKKGWKVPKVRSYLLKFLNSC